jgi:UDP-N-acetylmuramoyl-tripeptide--D-alanyl-D-alanine ligase
MHLKLSEIAARCGGYFQGEDAVAAGFATDNREIKIGDIFVAIKGERVDGHDFVPAAFDAGAVAVLVEKRVHGRYILVENVVEALAKMALSFREEFSGPVIGITGSAGKTTTKEFTASACSALGEVLKTEGNRNSEFTGPLLWPDLTENTKVVIAEMGMRGFGQIAHLAAFHKPTIGVVTNIGYSHVELVESREGIAKAKGEMIAALHDDGVAVLFSEDEYLGNLIAIAGNRKIRTFGSGGNANCQVTNYEPLDWTSANVEGVLDGNKWSTKMPTVGRHIANNVAAAILAATEAGVSLEDASRGIESAKLPPMRMEIREFQGATLVMDNYNSNPPAVLAAIQTLEEVPCSGKRIVVLGTMRELGNESEEGHRAVGRRLSKANVDHIFVYGDETQFIEQEFAKRGGDASRFEQISSLDVLKYKLSFVTKGDTVLVKGSRSLEMERAF